MVGEASRSVSIPRLVISGPTTGVGKTTVTLALILALARRGLRVQPFKAGPDFIDAGFHSAAANRPCHNLDAWLLPRPRLLSLFEQETREADIAVIEGVMGLFDGVWPDRIDASTGDLARFLSAPVLLVVDASAMGGSVAPLVQGFSGFEKGVSVGGVILNKVAGARHFELLRDALRGRGNPPLLGWFPEMSDVVLKERHLGLVPVQEAVRLRRNLIRLRDGAEMYLDLDGIETLAASARRLASVRRPAGGERAPYGATGDRPRVAVARDEAFHFYYEASLTVLRTAGLELVEFSPLRDTELPAGTAGLLFGGGFPEVFAERLSRNAVLRGVLRQAIEAGMPVYAECGGLMYLVQSLRDREGTRHPMLGILPGEVVMTDRLQNFGYAEAVTRRSTFLGHKGTELRGHEFHYSYWDHDEDPRWALYRLRRPDGGGWRLSGFARGSIVASYLHTHFAALPSAATSFARAVSAFRS